jgi:hypothetical protein
VRQFTIKGGTCAIPADARAVALNVTVTQASASTWLALYPSGIAWPGVSTINFSPNQWALANGAIVPLAEGTYNDISALVSQGTVHMILDVTGYFKP